MKEKGEMKALQLRGPVRITLPAKVAYNLDSLKSGIAAIMERLGCETCFSGAHCTFQLERDFLINEKLEIVSRESPFLPTDPVPWRTSRFLPQDPVPNLPIQVTLPGTVHSDIDQILSLVDKIVGRLGHLQCFSGFDIAFGLERELIVDEALNLNVGPRF